MLPRFAVPGIWDSRKRPVLRPSDTLHRPSALYGSPTSSPQLVGRRIMQEKDSSDFSRVSIRGVHGTSSASIFAFLLRLSGSNILIGGFFVKLLVKCHSLG